MLGPALTSDAMQNGIPRVRFVGERIYITSLYPRWLAMKPSCS